MAKFVLAYKGGGMAPSEAEQKAAMAEWGRWFQSLGAAVVDGGSPFAQAQTIAADGSVKDGGSLSGYSIINADNLQAAVKHAKGCPILKAGGTIEVHEAIPIPM